MRNIEAQFSKVISKNKVLKSMSNSKVPRVGLVSYGFYGQGHRVNVDTHGRTLPL